MLLAAACITFAGCAGMAPGVAPPLPPTLAAPADQALASVALASGVQIYDCLPSKADAAKLEWTFRAPEATLVDRDGRAIGKHYAGPTWEALDGSRVVGEVRARDNGPDPAAIPWLLLSAQSNQGSGLFGATRSIQRLETRGGKAPAGACPASGQVARVPYTASYWFYDGAR